MISQSEKEDVLKAAPVADYMKIRQHVVALVERGESPAMIPSMNELARSFGVTRMTVHKALKDLIKDKYLVVRKGIGTFINPARMKTTLKPQCCVGMIVGDGKHCFYGAFYWNLISAVGKETTARRRSFKLLNLGETKPEELTKEIKANWVDAVVWLDPSAAKAASALKLLQAEGFPVVALHSKVDGVDFVDMDWEGGALETGRKLLAEGRRNIVVAGVGPTPPHEKQVEGIRKAFAERGEKFNEKFVLETGKDVAAGLEEILDFGIEVQAILAVTPILPQLAKPLEKRGIDIKRACRLVAEPFFLDEIEGFCGLVREYSFEKEAKAALELLERRMKSPGAAPEGRVFEFSFRAEGDVE